MVWALVLSLFAFVAVLVGNLVVASVALAAALVAAAVVSVLGEGSI